MTRDLRNFCSFQLNFRFFFVLLIFQLQIINAQQIEQFWCLEIYELFVSAEEQLADPLFSSYSVPDLVQLKYLTARLVYNVFAWDNLTARFLYNDFGHYHRF